MRAEPPRPALQQPPAEAKPGCRVAIHHSFDAHPRSVRAALKQTLAHLVCDVSPEDAGALEIVLAEICNNIVEHGYADCGCGTITLSVYPEAGSLLCTVGDLGREVPRGCLEASDCGRPRPEDLPEGGFGWFLIRDLVRDLHYRREEDRNLLAFRLPLSPPAPTE